MLFIEINREPLIVNNFVCVLIRIYLLNGFYDFIANPLEVTSQTLNWLPKKNRIDPLTVWEQPRAN